MSKNEEEKVSKNESHRIKLKRQRKMNEKSNID